MALLPFPYEPARFTVLSFDCYGTLIDWESGILAALRPLLARHGVSLPDAELLARYAELESALEAGPYRPYRQILEDVVRELGRGCGFRPSAEEAAVLWRSLPGWPAFPDTVAALRALQQQYRLAVISNTDDDLFAATARSLGVEFEVVVTAQQAGSYKPALHNFRLAQERIAAPPGTHLHVAQSLYHDIAPAQALGLAAVWVARSSRRSGHGATPAATVQPEAVVPDLSALAALLLG